MFGLKFLDLHFLNPKLLERNIFLTYIFLDPNLLGSNFVLLKILYLIFWTKISIEPTKEFWIRKFFFGQIFIYKKFLGPKFFGPKIFFWHKFFLDQNLFGSNIFLLKIFYFIFLNWKFFFGHFNLININIFSMLGLLQQCRRDLFVLHDWSQLKSKKSIGCIARLSLTELGTAQP